ncbi:MAG: hypothetical protein LBV21_01970, partial [Candidatus Adiutrix sp.]|nr:hypothetical protein [Candidatus Adiutrix sp.]
MPAAILKNQPRGSVLLFTLVILVLLALMGTALMINTRTELTISHNTYQGRDAFGKADTTARLAVFLGRALLNESAGPICSLLTAASPISGRPGFEIRIGTGSVCTGSSGYTDLDLNSIKRVTEMPDMADIAQRYLQATNSTAGAAPQLTILYDGQVVGTASLALYYSDINSPGRSQGDTGYGSQGENSVRVHLVISA